MHDAVGVVVLSPLRSATAPQHQQRLMLLAMVILDALTGIWMLSQYAYEVCTCSFILGGFTGELPLKCAPAVELICRHDVHMMFAVLPGHQVLPYSAPLLLLFCCSSAALLLLPI